MNQLCQLYSRKNHLLLLIICSLISPLCLAKKTKLTAIEQLKSDQALKTRFVKELEINLQTDKLLSTPKSEFATDHHTSDTLLSLFGQARLSAKIIKIKKISSRPKDNTIYFTLTDADICRQELRQKAEKRFIIQTLLYKPCVCGKIESLWILPSRYHRSYFPALRTHCRFI